MRECPKCHYVDPPYWRNRLFDYEVDICQLPDVFQMDFDLYLQLATSPRGTTIIKGVYAYKLTKTDWVYRIWLPLLKVRSWNPQKYYDGQGSKASALRKKNLQAYMGAYPAEKKANEKIRLMIESIKRELNDLVEQNFAESNRKA